MRGVDSNEQAGPLCQRPDYKSSADALVSIQRGQGKAALRVPTHLRTRQNNTLDPALQQHFRNPTTLQMVEFQLEHVFLVIFILNMDRMPIVVEVFILGPSMARVALSRVARQRMVGPAITTTTPESRSD